MITTLYCLGVTPKETASWNWCLNNYLVFKLKGELHHYHKGKNLSFKILLLVDNALNHFGSFWDIHKNTQVYLPAPISLIQSDEISIFTPLLPQENCWCCKWMLLTMGEWLLKSFTSCFQRLHHAFQQGMGDYSHMEKTMSMSSVWLLRL